MKDLSPYKEFPIVRPPRFMWWVKFSNAIVGLSLLCVMGALYAGSPELALVFLLISMGNWISRTIRSRSKTFDSMGAFQVGYDFFLIENPSGAEPIQVPFQEIQRIDLFYSRGVTSSFRQNYDAFESIMAMRMAIRTRRNQLFMLCLRNCEVGDHNFGAFYDEMMAIKRKVPGMYQRIQFWHKF